MTMKTTWTWKIRTCNIFSSFLFFACTNNVNRNKERVLNGGEIVYLRPRTWTLNLKARIMKGYQTIK